MKKYYWRYWHYFFIFVILLFALLIRLNHLGSISGLWYDEITIYSIAVKKTLLLTLQEDSHRFLLFPLYYLVYKFWIATFGNSDYVIRLMSVFFDMAAVVCAYFAGVNFASLLNKHDVKYKIGLYTMLLYAINSSFIYYAQEAKFYSMTFFLINVLMIFWSKYLMAPTKKNAILFLISNALLLYTYTSQILLLLAVQIVTFIYFFVKRKSEVKTYISQFLGFIIVLIPIFVMVLHNHQYFTGNFDAVVYDNSFILLVFQNYFSPVLAGLQNNILSYQNTILINIFNPKWWVFIFFPIIFNFVLIAKSCKKELFSKLFLSVAVLYVGFHIISTQFMSYAPMVRYLLPALPVLIVVGANGLEILCRKKIAMSYFLCF